MRGTIAHHNAFVEAGRYGRDHLDKILWIGCWRINDEGKDLVSKLLAEDATMWYATKIGEWSNRGMHCGMARRLQVFTRPIPFAVDFGLEPFWTAVRLMP
jgi:hypothetical protein